MLNLLLGQLDRKKSGTPVRLAQRNLRDKHFASREPLASVCHHIADIPVLVVKKKILAMADLAV
jgi:hypothetical protein